MTLPSCDAVLFLMVLRRLALVESKSNHLTFLQKDKNEWNPQTAKLPVSRWQVLNCSFTSQERQRRINPVWCCSTTVSSGTAYDMTCNHRYKKKYGWTNGRASAMNGTQVSAEVRQFFGPLPPVDSLQNQQFFTAGKFNWARNDLRKLPVWVGTSWSDYNPVLMINNWSKAKISGCWDLKNG